jgi:hypothetical protein
LREAALLLRYRTTNTADMKLKYLSYPAIAKALRLSAGQVQHLCNYKSGQVPAEKDEVLNMKVLDQEQIDYLTSDATHTRMAGKTLEERARLFELRYPGKKLNRYGLRKIYREHGIKRKAVCQVKLVPERD